MTLLDMIKKYERIKHSLEQEHVSRHNFALLRCDIEVVDQFLKDLKSVAEQRPSLVNVRHKILKKIDKLIDSGDYSDAQMLAQTLSILPS